MLGKFFGKSRLPPVPSRNHDRSPATLDDNRFVRVFISSTFVDMQVERDILVRRTFPALRARLRPRGVELLEVDLRWGVKQEDVENGKTLPICLTEVARCKPYFIGLLGDRYGTQLTSDMLDPEAVADFPVLRDGIGRSMTEIEIMQVLRDANAAKAAFFFVRDPKGAPANIEPEGTEAIVKLEQLKARIRASGAIIVPYARPEDIGTTVELAFGTALEANFPEVKVPDRFAQTLGLHNAYARERRELQIGTAPYFAALDQWLAEPAPPPLLITGASGSGKGTLVANWVQARRASNPSDIVIEHYLAASPDSAEPRPLLRRIWEHLNWATGDEVELPNGDADLMDLSSGLVQRLVQASLFAARIGIDILIALDGLDKLSGDQDLRWLPRALPPRIKLLGSASESEARRAAIARDWRLLEVKPLSREERQAFVINALERIGKSLSPDRITRVISHPLAGTPLFLKAMLDELRFSATNERLDTRLEFYLGAGSLADLFARQLDRLEGDCGTAFVASAASQIWASRAGLEEAVILELTGASPLAWATLRNGLGESLRDRQGRMTFANDFMRRAVETRYLDSVDKKRTMHLLIAEHFDRRPFGARSAEELPYQLQAADAWERLESVLTDLDRFILLAERGDAELLGYWLSLRDRNPEALLCEALGKHVENGSWGESEVRLAFAIGKFLRFSGAKGEPLQRLFSQIADATERLFGRSHQLTLASTSNLASILAARGDLVGARMQQEQLLALSARVLGADHPDTLTSMSNLAGTLKSAGDFARAHTLYMGVLQGRARVLGGEHPDTLVSMNNVAMTMAARGEVRGALELQGRALAACTRLLGQDHPDTLTCLNNLASLRAMDGDLSGAQELEDRVLVTRARLFGQEHPDTLISMNNLAATLYARGNFEGALKQQEQVLETRMLTLGPDHPMTLTSLNNLAQTLSALGNFEDAQQLQDRLVNVSAHVLGADHPDTLMSMNNLAMTLCALGDLDRAKDLQERALESTTRLLGADHPDTLTCMSNLGEILDKSGDLAGAQSLAERVNASMVRVLGPNHPSTLTSAFNLGVCLLYRGDLDSARMHFARVAEARRRIFGADHPETKAAEEGIAVVKAANRRQAFPGDKQTPQQSRSAISSSLNPFTFGAKAQCCWNALMAAYTYSLLDEETRDLVRAKTLEIHRSVTKTVSLLDDLPLTTIGRYHFFSLAMQNLDMRPRIGRELWFKVRNPFDEQAGAEAVLPAVKAQLEKQFGITLPNLLGGDPFPPRKSM